MAGQLVKYAFIHAKIRARISKLLPREIFEQMQSAGSIDEALVALRNTPFSALEEIYSKTGDLMRAELELLKNEIGVYHAILRHLRDATADFVRALLLRFETDNLKNALRIFFDRSIRKRAVEDAAYYLLYDTISHNLAIDAVINAKDMAAVAQSLAGTPYGAICAQHGAAVERDRSLFPLEVALDHFFYRTLIEKTQNLDKKDRAEARRIIGVEIDLQNINWIIRFRSYYNLSLERVLALSIPGGRSLDSATIRETYTSHDTGAILNNVLKKQYPGLTAMLAAGAGDNVSRLSLVERVLSLALHHEIERTLLGYPFTICIILSYFLLKKNETARVQTLLNAKYYGMPHARIEEVF